MNFLDLFFPKRCLGCGRLGKYMCSSCQQKIPPLPYLKCPVCGSPAMGGMTHPKCRTKYTIDGLISFFRYDGIIRQAIKQIKYRYVTDMVEELIHNISASSFEIFHTSHFIHHAPCLIPIPLHSSRYNFRGFNQAEMIARALGKRLSVPVKTDILVRTRKTTPQVEMKERDKRLANMKDVFSLRTSYVIPRTSSTLLVDDIFTTGATMRSAASVLKHSGVNFVWGITLAQ